MKAAAPQYGPTQTRAADARSRSVVVTALGITQILAWGSSYYLPAILAQPIAGDTGWSLAWVVGGFSLGLLAEGLCSPYVGDAIERYGGRPVLAASACLLASGLLGLALAPSLPIYIFAWLVLGVGMAAGLYGAAFSALGQLYGREARRAITALTLFGGFASTLCWPLSAFLSSELGWRGTCVVYAVLHLALALPIYLVFVPRETRRAEVRPHASEHPMRGDVDLPNRRQLFVLVAAAFTLSSVTATVMAVHLITFLEARDIALAAAVALGALVGPSQVGARILEMIVGHRHHPVWTMMASTVLIAAGIAILWSGAPIVALALVLYGSGMGIKSIVRGTLPLAVFGPRGYAPLLGRISMPSLVAGAAAPSLGALLIEQFGVEATLVVLMVAALCNVGLVVLLWISFNVGRRTADVS